MLNVVPVAISDQSRLKAFVDVLEALGPYQQDRLLILPTPEAFADRNMKDQMNRLVRLFNDGDGEVKQIVPVDGGGGWMPQNKHWMLAVKEVANREKALFLRGANEFIEQWMYLETDFIPVRSGWMEDLNHDYRYVNMPYHGMLVDTVKVRSKNNEKYEIPEGTHMVGCGIYPAFYAYTPKDSNNNLLRARQAPPGGPPNTLWKHPIPEEPFDIRCQNEHRPCFNNKKLHHRWRTCNYRIEDSALVCDDVKKSGFEKLYAGPIHLDSDSIGVHGCVDGSLSKLVINGELVVSQLPKKPIAQRKSIAEILPPSNHEEDDENQVNAILSGKMVEPPRNVQRIMRPGGIKRTASGLVIGN